MKYFQDLKQYQKIKLQNATACLRTANEDL